MLLALYYVHSTLCKRVRVLRTGHVCPSFVLNHGGVEGGCGGVEVVLLTRRLVHVVLCYVVLC